MKMLHRITMAIALLFAGPAFSVDTVTTPGGSSYTAIAPAGATVPIIATSPLSPPSASSSVITNPTSTLTRPADTTAYASGDLVASSTTAGSIVVPSFAITNSAGGAIIPRVRLTTNKTSGWGIAVTVNLWSTAPTYTNGDNGAYAVATGAAGWLCSFAITLMQYADGATGFGSPSVGNACIAKLASGTAIYWDLQVGAAATPASGQTFTLTAEVLN